MAIRINTCIPICFGRGVAEVADNHYYHVNDKIQNGNTDNHIPNGDVNDNHPNGHFYHH